MCLLTSPDDPFRSEEDTSRTRKYLYRCALPIRELRNDPVQTVFVARDPDSACATAEFSEGRCEIRDILEKRSILGADLY
jgi:hypothetical protein